ncbi:MAG: xanthine dehydrogenase family protein molybdopterin-binding subunit [Candidatus Rokubacteria bacterium]|nr:xanthine dehydrogenase family protein molybdopterin-binding subunit [Candidatus Rokubacteria bacterium]
MGQFGIGQAVTRFEDPRLLRGEGRFLGDVSLPGQTYAVVVRSPHAHARLRSIDASAATRAPGVLGVLTGADVARDGLGTTRMTLRRKRPDGSPMFAPPHPGLVRDRVRYVGDPVALVVAETPAQAEDAAGLVRIDYEPLPSVTSTAEAGPGSPPVWDECPDNVSNVFEVGDRTATDAAFARAHRVIRRRYVITRVHAQYMEPRGALGLYDPGEDRYTLYADVQYPHRVRNALASMIFRVPEHKIRVIAGDIGGGFGAKGWQYAEHRLVLWAARKLRRPVKWTCERHEALLADEHARDNISEAELALDAEGRFLALRVRTTANLGAYVSSDRNLLPTFSNVATLVGVYTIPAAHVHVTGVLTNTSPTAPYRGAGRPEASYVTERLIDAAARALGMDPVELRRANLIPPSAMPYRTALGATYDCGEFEQSMDEALKLADVAGFAARRAAARRRGALRGIGVANAIERAAPPGPEFAEIRFDPSGTAMILMGTKNQGQGHETTFKQILHERLGLDPGEVRFVDGDTDRVAFGMGSTGSRSTVIGGTALWMAADKVIAKGRKIAARMLEAAEADIVFAEGRFTVVGTDRAVAVREVARAAFQPAQLPPGLEPGLYETGTFSPPAATFPNGCHVCELEIDEATGAVTLVNYVVVDDVGTVVNPLTLEGQIHGGVAQGLGQALMEQVVYDRDSGQLLTSTFMDYGIPRADTLCDLTIERHPVPTTLNPLGAKGAGEAGTVGALPAVINAVVSALAPLGVRDFDMPATSARVWRAIQDAVTGRQR